MAALEAPATHRLPLQHQYRPGFFSSLFRGGVSACLAHMVCIPIHRANFFVANSTQLLQQGLISAPINSYFHALREVFRPGSLLRQSGFVVATQGVGFAFNLALPLAFFSYFHNRRVKVLAAMDSSVLARSSSAVGNIALGGLAGFCRVMVTYPFLQGTRQAAMRTEEIIRDVTRNLTGEMRHVNLKQILGGNMRPYYGSGIYFVRDVTQFAVLFGLTESLLPDGDHRLYRHPGLAFLGAAASSTVVTAWSHVFASLREDARMLDRPFYFVPFRAFVLRSQALVAEKGLLRMLVRVEPTMITVARALPTAITLMLFDWFSSGSFQNVAAPSSRPASHHHE
eukprot:m.247865 g.247865  ORF g.247865 m.247865 type:complete len:340 (+) comp15546_c0_seq1:41-1060(+)